MSTELQVYMHPENVLTASAWQQHIIAAGFDLCIDIDSPLQDQSGFQPATLDGEAAGFEFDLFPPDELTPDLAQAIKGRTLVATFRTGSSMNEMRSSYIAACALAEVADGVFYDTEGGKSVLGINAIAFCRQALAGIESPAASGTQIRDSPGTTTKRETGRPWWKVW